MMVRIPSQLFAAIALAISFASPALAANDAQAQYQKMKADCNAGKSSEDRATCLKEAGAAFEEAKRGRLNDADADYRKNEMERCKALAGAEQRDCLARMKGSGTSSGSVGGGGILREKVTKEVVRPAGVVPTAPAASAGS